MDSSEISTTSFSSSQGNILYKNSFFKINLLVPVNKSDENLIFENCSGVNIEVIRTAFNLHKQGLMMPWIFQCLYKVFNFLFFF